MWAEFGEERGGLGGVRAEEKEADACMPSGGEVSVCLDRNVLPIGRLTYGEEA